MDSILPPDVPPVGQPDLYLPPELIPDLDQLPSEDGKPVDNIYVERLYRLLTDPLYASWSGPGEGRPWVALSNVGWYHTNKAPALVPDVLVSLDVEPRNPRAKEGRSYIQWVVGKQPDLIIEIVSDRSGGEDGYKRNEYSRLGVPYYVIYDPEEYLDGGVLRGFELRRRRYITLDLGWIEELNLGLTFWEGTFQGIQETWLRWCDQQGRVLLTGAERAVQADQLRQQAEDGNARLRAQLRALGVEPEA